MTISYHPTTRLYSKNVLYRHIKTVMTVENRWSKTKCKVCGGAYKKRRYFHKYQRFLPS